MPAIDLRAVSNYALKDVDLSIDDKELMVLLGPTGAGKTTILNVIAGLTSYNGAVYFDDEKVDGIPPAQRGVGYLLQRLALFPHLDVAANIGYSLRSKKVSKREGKRRVEELTAMMHLSHLVHRYPKDLSGGERQRVALARALASSPRVLLLDEPLASVDQRFSKYFRLEFRRIQRKLGITTVYVTHNFSEAEEMGDRIAVTYKGRIEQVGRHDDIFFSPETDNVARFIGEPNIFQCRKSRSLGNGLVEVTIGDAALVVPHDGDTVRKIAIHPGHVHLYKEALPYPQTNRLFGRVAEVTVFGFMVRLKVTVHRVMVIAEMTQELFEKMDLRVGETVNVVMKMQWIKII